MHFVGAVLTANGFEQIANKFAPTEKPLKTDSMITLAENEGHLVAKDTHID